MYFAWKAECVVADRWRTRLFMENADRCKNEAQKFKEL
jgi:hypothetical protein